MAGLAEDTMIGKDATLMAVPDWPIDKIGNGEKK